MIQTTQAMMMKKMNKCNKKKIKDGEVMPKEMTMSKMMMTLHGK
jgi:hypothetical protein